MDRRLYAASCLTVTLTASLAEADVRRVPQDFATLGGALSAAQAGDTLEVAAGTYAPSTNGETFPLVIAVDDLQILGQGMGVSIVDAEGSASVFDFDTAGGGRIHGFTITGGGTTDEGGGIRIRRGTVEVDHNFVWANGAKLRGAGIDVTGGADPWIHHNVVWESFDTNLSHPGDPHGIQIHGAATRCRAENNLIGRGDSNGLFFETDTTAMIRNNIFLENGTPAVRGRGICAFGTSESVVAHNVFHGNAIAALIVEGAGNVSASVANDLDPTDNIYANLDADPRLVDPSSHLFSLQPDSPAIDAGDPSSPSDPDGTVADAGPFYYDQTPLSTPPSARALVEMLPNAPNPFNPSTLVRYRTSRPTWVEIEVLDARGRRVRRLFAGLVREGVNAVRWDGMDASGRPVVSGVYLASITFEGARTTAPMALVR
jgi:hypothetical protein